MKNDPQDHDQTSGHQAVMESITKRMGGLWLVGFDKNTGKPFARACARNSACIDALLPFKDAFSEWIDQQSHK